MESHYQGWLWADNVLRQRARDLAQLVPCPSFQGAPMTHLRLCLADISEYYGSWLDLRRMLIEQVRQTFRDISALLHPLWYPLLLACKAADVRAFHDALRVLALLPTRYGSPEPGRGTAIVLPLDGHPVATRADEAELLRLALEHRVVPGAVLKHPDDIVDSVVPRNWEGACDEAWVRVREGEFPANK